MGKVYVHKECLEYTESVLNAATYGYGSFESYSSNILRQIYETEEEIKSTTTYLKNDRLHLCNNTKERLNDTKENLNNFKDKLEVYAGNLIDGRRNTENEVSVLEREIDGIENDIGSQWAVVANYKAAKYRDDDGNLHDQKAEQQASIEAKIHKLEREKQKKREELGVKNSTLRLYIQLIEIVAKQQEQTKKQIEKVILMETDVKKIKDSLNRIINQLEDYVVAFETANAEIENATGKAIEILENMKNRVQKAVKNIEAYINGCTKQADVESEVLHVLAAKLTDIVSSMSKECNRHRKITNNIDAWEDETRKWTDAQTISSIWKITSLKNDLHEEAEKIKKRAEALDGYLATVTES